MFGSLSDAIRLARPLSLSVSLVVATSGQRSNGHDKKETSNSQVCILLCVFPVMDEEIEIIKTAMKTQPDFAAAYSLNAFIRDKQSDSSKEVE